MTIEQRLEKLAEAFGVQDEMVKALREALTLVVAAELETGQRRTFRSE